MIYIYIRIDEVHQLNARIHYEQVYCDGKRMKEDG